MGRTSYLAKNIGLLTVSQFSTKLLAFFLVPFYTSILSADDYGTFDLFTATVALLIPILTLGIASSVLRFAMERNADLCGVLSYGLRYFAISTLVVALLVGVNYAAGFVVSIQENSLLVFLLFATTNLSGFISNFARGTENIKAIAIGGVISTSAAVGLNILFLLPLHMGLTGYMLANIIAAALHSAYLVFATKAWRYVSAQKVNPSLKKEMLAYAKPLVANDISWWVNNVSDRYIVTWLCGVSANGIYSVAYKIPSILTMFQGFFAQAWTLSAIKDIDAADSADYFSKMYAMYNFAMTAICSALIVCSRFFARILYAKDFYAAWEYVPFLLISVVFGALAGYVGAIFGAAKDTRVFAHSSVAGAVANIVLNIVLIRFIGVIGAAVATAASYFLIWVIRLFSVRRFVKLRIRFVRDCAVYVLLVAQSVLMVMCKSETAWLYVAETCLLAVVMVLNMENIRLCVQFCNQKFHKKLGENKWTK